MRSLRDWALALPSQGRFTFTTADARTALDGSSEKAVVAALERAEADRLIASPVRGFHVVLPLEDRSIGTPSWRLFLDPLMTHLGMPYYVGLLTAASIHGASGQAAQVDRGRQALHGCSLVTTVRLDRRASRVRCSLVQRSRTSWARAMTTGSIEALSLGRLDSASGLLSVTINKRGTVIGTTRRTRARGAGSRQRGADGRPGRSRDRRVRRRRSLVAVSASVRLTAAPR